MDTTPYAPQSLSHAIALAVRRGRIVVAGLKGLRPAREVPVDDVIYKELTIRGVLSMPVDDTFRAIHLIESGLAIVPGLPRVSLEPPSPPRRMP